jgi:hypothetical protein
MAGCRLVTRQHGSNAVLIAALVCGLCRGGARAAEPPPTIDATNYEAVRQLLPPSVVDWLRRGELTLVLGAPTYEPRWEQSFLAASTANEGRYDVDDSGTLVDPATGARPPHTYGLPFPRIALGDAKAGSKVMWNVSFIFLKPGALRVPFGFEWIGPQGFERAVKGEATDLPFDGQPAARAVPNDTEQRQLFRGLGPASIEGIAALTWRFMDGRPDSVWNYLPALRRVRAVTAANRSDPFFGSDLVQDDGLLWAGKNQSFHWRLTGEQEVLVPTVAPDLVHLVAGASGPNGQEWRSPPTYPGAQLGWQTPGWRGAPWLLGNAVWVRRPVWVVEGVPKDPYYNYGRQIFYVDRGIYKIYYKIVYTPSGEYWKTLFNDFGMAATPDDTERQVITAAAIAVDDRAQHATYGNGAGPKAIIEYHSAQLTPADFTLPGLLRAGK